MASHRIGVLRANCRWCVCAVRGAVRGRGHTARRVGRADRALLEESVCGSGPRGSLERGAPNKR